MGYKYYSADRVREKMPRYKGTDEELQMQLDKIDLLYSSAVRELETKLQILSDDFGKKNSYTPIHHVTKRVKTLESIIDKAERYGIEDPINNLDTVMKQVLDIAGVRVVTNYEEDIYTMSDILLKQNDIELIRVKDYCKSPKESGYRSLHVVVSIPVYLVNTVEMVPIEIQFRSIAMDTWASLEHELRYKNKGELSEDIKEQLKDCASRLHEVDRKMSAIRHEVLGD